MIKYRPFYGCRDLHFSVSTINISYRTRRIIHSLGVLSLRGLLRDVITCPSVLPLRLEEHFILVMVYTTRTVLRFITYTNCSEVLLGFSMDLIRSKRLCLCEFFHWSKPVPVGVLILDNPCFSLDPDTLRCQVWELKKWDQSTYIKKFPNDRTFNGVSIKSPAYVKTDLRRYVFVLRSSCVREKDPLLEWKLSLQLPEKVVGSVTQVWRLGLRTQSPLLGHLPLIPMTLY